MKPRKLLVFVLSLFLITISLNSSFAQSSQDLLMHKWEVDVETFYNVRMAEMDEQERAEYGEMLNTVVAAMKGTTFEFRKGGELLITSSGVENKGKWRLKGDKTLYFKNHFGIEEEMEIKEISEKVLYLEKDDKSSFIPFKR